MIPWRTPSRWRMRRAGRKPTVFRSAGRGSGEGAVDTDRRFVVLMFAGLAAILAVSARLFDLQVVSSSFYSALASDQHGIYEELFPERGSIYLRDSSSAGGVFPAAVNRNLATVVADGRRIGDAADAAAKLSPILGLDAAELESELSAADDPYIPIKRGVDEATLSQVSALAIEGVGSVSERSRSYPERALTCHITGFLGLNEKGERVGRYGIEGFWQENLAGRHGFLEAERDAFGRWIGSASRELRPAQDGVDLYLTVDRNIQYAACSRLKEAVAKHGASGGALVILEPNTGAVMAMCGLPEFDPNDYAGADIASFNNPTTWYAYEPGSVMKPITMAAAIDAGKITPNTTYEDTGSVVIGKYTIRNSDGRANGTQTMTQVLEKSLNTGAIFAVRKLGGKEFERYIRDFGFGAATGVELDSESAGDISSLAKAGDIWSATGSYGQGITVTPIQLAAAFAAIANGGRLVAPHVVDSVVSGGQTSRVETKVVRQVISKRAATLVSGMLVNVVENGHGKRAGVPGYWVAGKTGTAQIPGKDGRGYEKDAFIGTFVGFAPVDDPAFVMVVKIDRPKDTEWAEATAAPVFGEVASFLLQYLKIPPDRPVK